MFKDDIGHWDGKITRAFSRNLFWWPEMYKGVTNSVKSCEGCQHARRIPRYRTNLRDPMTGLFETSSMDFAGPSRPFRDGRIFSIIVIELMGRKLIPWATK